MRNLTEENTTDVVLNAWSENPDPRFKEIMDAMITHLNDFVREVQLTGDEWGATIKYLHACAHRSSWISNTDDRIVYRWRRISGG